MTNVTFMIGIALAFLLLLWIAARRGSAEEHHLEDNADGGTPNEVRLPSRALLDQCLSNEDLELVAGVRSRAVLDLFLRERRRIALAWLRETRREAHRLLSLHFRMARHAAGLRPAMEMRVLFAAAAFVVVHAMLFGAVAMYGPFQARGFLRSLRAMAHVLSNLGGRIAESVGPTLAAETAR